MTTPTVTDMLKYANLQMAAEALYNFKENTKKTSGSGLALTQHPIYANHHVQTIAY